MRPMKIYVLADMEGIAGIRLMEQVRKENPEFYGEGRKLMMGEINVVVDELAKNGVSEIVVCDTHFGGGQLELSLMDSRAVYELPYQWKMMPSLDETYDGVILLGHHARAGTLNGFLDHTFASASIFEYAINGRVVGEIATEAAYAGHYGVPVILVSGDETTAREAREDLGEVECVVVKCGLGRNRARCLAVDTARELLRDGIRKSLKRIGEFRPLRFELPATIRQTFYRSDMADALAGKPEVERIDSRTVQKKVSSLLEVRCW